VIRKFVGGALQVSGGGGRLREMHQVEGIEVAEETGPRAAWSGGWAPRARRTLRDFSKARVLGEVTRSWAKRSGRFKEDEGRDPR